MTTPKLEQRHWDALDNVIRAFQMLNKHISVQPLVELAAILRAMEETIAGYERGAEHDRIALRDAELRLCDARNEISNLTESLAHADNRASEAERLIERLKAEIQGPTFMGEPAITILPQRPAPAAAANTVGLDWDAYSGMQMIAYGRQCADIVAAPAPQPAAVPDGWQLVPKVPTDEMLKAGVRTFQHAYNCDDPLADWRATYSAYLLHAPQLYTSSPDHGEGE